MHMPSTSPAHQALVFSYLTVPGEYGVFSAICRQWRRRHARLKVAGVLLFDGHRFGQWLRGSRPAVQAALAGLAQDARHERLVVLVEGTSAAAGPQPSLVAGYCDPHGMDMLEGPDRAQQEAAIAVFRRLLARAALCAVRP